MAQREKPKKTANVFEKEQYIDVRISLEQAMGKSASWYQKKIAALKNISPTQIMKDHSEYRTKPIKGEMYVYYYLPKHRETLPYWDMFPLVLPLSYDKDGMLGMNFHYIRPQHRIMLLDEIKKHGWGPKKTIINYDIISSFARSRFAEPTIKRYLWSQFGTPLRRIAAVDIPTALLVPCEKFYKMDKNKVWKQYRQ
jgi:hypothetical protein